MNNDNEIHPGCILLILLFIIFTIKECNAGNSKAAYRDGYSDSQQGHDKQR